MIVQTALGNTSGYQYYGGDRYVGTRNLAGWAINPTAPGDPAITAGGRRWGSALGFAPDLDAWAQITATQPQYAIGVAQLFTGGLDDSYEPLSPLLAPIDDSGSEKVGQSVLDLEFTGASADLTAAIVKVTLASTAYLPDDPRSNSFIVEPGGDRNSYLAFINEAGQPDLELLARDKDGKVWGGRCGSHLGGPYFLGSITNTFNQGAISPDGSRLFFSTRPAQEWDPEEGKEPQCDGDHGLRVLERVSTSEGPVISEIAPENGPADPGNDLFKAASEDGNRVYFLSPRKLTGTDTDAKTDPCSATIGASEGCDLYLYDSTQPEGERLTQASDGEGSEPADVLNSTTAISGDGSRAYFVAQGVLTSDENPEGAAAIAGEPNLYLYEAASDELSFIANLVEDDASGLWDIKGTLFGDAYAAPYHGDGHVLAFASKAKVTDDDNDGGFRDVFRYDANAETLERISKAAPGGSDDGEFDATVNPAVLKIIEYNFGETTRWMSEDAEVIAFATEEPLVPGDSGTDNNPYVWNGGELGAVFAPITEPPAAAPAQGQIAFATPKALLPRDGDVVKDIYVARANGGFVEPVPPTPCNPLQEGNCQGPPSQEPGPVPLPADGANVKQSSKKCKKGQIKRRGKCVKKPRKGKRAGHNRGGKR